MKFMHIRCYKQGAQLPSARGGVTIAFKKDEKGDLYKVAYAVCSEKDNYCKKTGRDEATKHLLENKLIFVEVDESHSICGQIIDTLEAYFDYKVLLDGSFNEKSMKLLKQELCPSKNS